MSKREQKKQPSARWPCSPTWQIRWPPATRRQGMIVKEVGKGIQLLLSGSETMISAGVSGWALFGIASAISLLIGNEYLSAFIIVMFIVSSGAALIGCLLHLVELLAARLEKEEEAE